ncbi:MAG: cell division protein ZapE [Endozoicomonas sp. (ex Botrylloides leachii)]|nr:cell division protein ZapE [Endozoicomonas sp. (ex Botrylloides leachii)]
MTPEVRYQRDLIGNGYTADPAQADAVKALQQLYEQLVMPSEKKFSLKYLLSKHESKPLKGVYLWGGVGRGKTWLMDIFYDCLPFENKQRMHFHHFMKYTHEQLQLHAGQKDPLKCVAKTLAGCTKVLCFDEFFVSDIADAMILAGLLNELFIRDVILVATSNVIPDELYKDGLQRARFLPAIALLKQYTQVLCVDNGIDYRLVVIQQATTYHYPLTSESHQQLQHTFIKLTQLSALPSSSNAITIEGRPISCIAQAKGVLWVTFAALCAGPRSQNDYIHLASLFHTVILESLPQLNENTNDQARRFISLIDELYDRRITLIISAKTAIEDIYQGSQLAFEFKRTISRLQEMQSTDYTLGSAEKWHSSPKRLL